MSLSTRPKRPRLRQGPAPHPAAREQTDDKKQDDRAGKRHDHLAYDRVADDLHIDVEDARQKTTEKGAEYADDDVAEQPEPMTQSHAAGDETRNQTDKTPDKDRVEIEVDGGPVDRYDHVGSPPLEGERTAGRLSPSGCLCGRSRASA